MVVDLSTATAEELAAAGRGLGRLGGRTDGGRGHLLMAGGRESDARLEKESAAADVAVAVEAAGGGAVDDLAAAIAEALRGLAGVPGRRVAVVVTDGARRSDREAWRRAAEAADQAGAPLLVTGLWSGRFDPGIRRQLRELAATTGGRLFLVQGAAGLETMLEEYGMLLDAAVSLRFAEGGGEVRLEATRPELEVRAPRRIR